MKIKDLGEFKLISKLHKRYPQLTQVPRGFLGIGDDCAVIPQGVSSAQLVSTDMLIEGIHFLFHRTRPEDLGYKSLAVNLSDIAAMGGIPKYAFLSLSLPKSLEYEWIKRFYKGFQDLAKKHHVLLLGGDTTGSMDVCGTPGAISISVTILGEVNPKKIKKRSMAQPDDLIYVTGPLGDSRAGLEWILKESPKYPKNIQTLVRRHFRPRPHSEEGLWLSQFSDVHAMMDLSDGLVSDLNHIQTQSSCGAQIDLDKLPLSRELLRATKNLKFEPTTYALLGGEDYVLLLTVDRRKGPILENKFYKKFKRKLFNIGQITSRPNYFEVRCPGDSEYKPLSKSIQGFRHF